jgi:uncharacterized membrane protein YeiB
MGWIALSYGLGLYGRISRIKALLICILVYTTLMIIANLWLRFVPLGPMERKLRSVTQGRFVSPTRRADSR